MLRFDRRHFVQTSGLLLAGAALPQTAHWLSAAEPAKPQGGYRKAVGWEMIVDKKLSVEDKVRLAKDVGFTGIEVNFSGGRAGAVDPKELAAASQKVGVPIHGVSAGSNLDLKGAIDEAAIYGATSVLHVVRTDPNAPFMETYRKSQELIRGAIPTAEKKKIPILVENVWATFLMEPLTMARYVDELASPWVKAYFDVGNVMRWGWPQHWIEVLGKRIGKVHVKEYSLKVGMKEGMGKGFDFPLGKGDIDWPRVCAQLKAINYHGWITAEVHGGDRSRLADISAQMDNVLKL
jgi:L-ribulose-5-phosphate 3-epimerase